VSRLHAFMFVMDQQPITCAFTVQELERLAEWAHRKQRIDFEPEDDELLLRIERLVAAAREPRRPRSA
jgi:hypothetical protein